MNIKILRIPNGENGNGGTPIETPGAGTTTGIDSALQKMFPEEYRGQTPPPDGGGGGTTDLSKTEEEAAAAEAAEQVRLQTLATESGKTVEEIQAEEANANESGTDEEAAEQARLEGLAAERGVTVEEIQAEEAAAAENKTAITDVAIKGLTKRIGGLLDRLDKSERENEELRAGRSEGGTALPNEVSRIVRAQDLAALQERTETSLEQTETMLAQLSYDTDGVAEQMRELAANNPALQAEFKKLDDDGKQVDDYSTAKMAKVLNRIKGTFKTTLKAIPQRAQFIQHRGRVTTMMREPEITKVAAFVTDMDSEEHELYRQFAQAGTGFANGELMAAAAVIGLRTLKPAMTALASRKLGRRPAATVPGRGPSRMPATTVPRVPKTGGSKFKQIKNKFMTSGSKADLEAALNAVGT